MPFNNKNGQPILGQDKRIKTKLARQITLKTAIILTFIFILTESFIYGQTTYQDYVFIQDTVKCQNVGYDLYFSDLSDKGFYQKIRFDTSKIEYNRPHFIDAKSMILFLSVHKYNISYNYAINLSCLNCRVDSNFLKNLKQHPIFISSRIAISYNGQSIFKDNIITNDRSKIHSPFPSNSEIIASPDSKYLYTVNNYNLYRYCFKTKKTEVTPFPIDKIFLGTCSKKRRLLIPYRGVDDTTYYLALFDKKLKVIDSFLIQTFNTTYLSLLGIQFNPTKNNEFYYSNQKGIYKVDIKTKQQYLIMESCRQKQIHNFSISHNGKYIVAEVLLKDYYKNKSIDTSNKLLLINIKDKSTKIITLNKE